MVGKIFMFIVLAVGFARASFVSDQESGQEGPKAYPDPSRFSTAIRAFEKADQESFPPTEAIVCVGSSSMLMWHDKIHGDLSPLRIIGRGFGGSTMHDAAYYADRIVIAYKPRAIVLYEGDNDIALGVSKEQFMDAFRQFVFRVHGALPGARIYVLSIKPSASRWALWPAMQEANALLAKACKKDKRLIFVDVAKAMLDTKGEIRPGLLAADGLHMSRAGYEVWRDVLRPILMERELKQEALEPDKPVEQGH